jgi:hypothetical protein
VAQDQACAEDDRPWEPATRGVPPADSLDGDQGGIRHSLYSHRPCERRWALCRRATGISHARRPWLPCYWVLLAGEVVLLWGWLAYRWIWPLQMALPVSAFAMVALATGIGAGMVHVLFVWPVVQLVISWIKRKGVIRILAGLGVVAVLGSGPFGCAVVPLIPGAAGVFYGTYKETETLLSGKKTSEHTAERTPSTTKGDSPQETP